MGHREASPAQVQTSYATVVIKKKKESNLTKWWQVNICGLFI
jgi:hypothetical protein